MLSTSKQIVGVQTVKLLSNDCSSEALEFQIFKNPLWSFFYIFSVGVFMAHACWGWQKVTPVLGIPRGHIKRVEILGYAIMIIMGLVYISFPLYVMLTKPFSGRKLS